jgi:hypothetical protein
MLIFALSIISAFLIAYGSYQAAEAVFSLPLGQMREAIRDLPGKRRLSDKLVDLFLVPLARLIGRLLPLSEYKHKHLKSDLDRLALEQTPQLFIGLTLAKSMLLACAGLIFIPLGLPWFTLLALVASVIAYFRNTQNLRNQVEKVNREIAAELPRLVESLIYALADNRDLVAFFEKYRKVAGHAMGRELDRLILAMKIGNHTLALRNMEARLAIPQLSALVSILCGVHQGVDQRTSLLILEQDIRTAQRELIRRDMEKRPGRIKAASFILTILMILMFMVPLVLLIIHNLQSVGF